MKIEKAKLTVLIPLLITCATLQGCDIRRTTNPPQTISPKGNGEADVKEDDYAQETTPPSFETEDERWDTENCVYSNFKYGFSLTLPNDIAWHLTSGTSKHTVFRIEQPDTEMVMFVNYHPMTDGHTHTDIWDNYDVFITRVLPEVKKLTTNNSAETVTNQEYSKCSFCGKHAIKVFWTSTLYDDRYDEPIEMETIDYVFYHHDALTTVTLKYYRDVKDALMQDGYDIRELLKGFLLVPRKDET